MSPVLPTESNTLRSATDGTLEERIAQTAGTLAQRLLQLDVPGLDLSDYFRGYLSQYLQTLSAVLQKQSWILARALDPSKPLEQQMLVDHGGGVGMFSLLAKALGIGTVLYSDIKPETSHGAAVLGTATGFPADFYITGDSPQLSAAIDRIGHPISALASSNVIEHIYDFDHFVEMLAAITGPGAGVVLATSANNANPRIRRRYMRLQQKLEFRGRGRDPGRRGYLEIRRRMITDCDRSLPEADITRLADRTRGLAGTDIEETVARYLRDGGMPGPPAHPTNTCCPLTGAWTERLLPAREWAAALRRGGFDTEILSGLYATGPDRNWRTPIRHGLNLGIRLLGRHALCVSPFLALKARRQADST
jgi:hypothetical protein